MKLIYYGHSCFSVYAGGKHLLFDPFITPNDLAALVDVDMIPADYILISHGHYDHINDLFRIAKRTGAMVLGNWELYTWLTNNGVTNTQPINPGGKSSFDFGVVKCVIAVHSSSLPDGTYAGIASGFVLDTPDGAFYYAGDTGLTLDMQLVPAFAQPGFAVFPLGDGLTMGIEDAIIAAGLVGVKKVVGVHYDTFDSIKLDRQKAINAFAKVGIRLYLPEIGSTISI